MPRLGVEVALGREDALSGEEAGDPSRPVWYVWFPGELSALGDALAGAPSGRSARDIAASLWSRPHRRVAPCPVRSDRPSPTVASIAELIRRPRAVAWS